MNKFRFFIVSSLATCVVGVMDAARAQSSRDELIAMGGKPLSGAELRQVLSGKQISGPTYDGKGSINWTLKSDGSFSGYGEYASGRTTDRGTWKVNEKGQFCFQSQATWPGGSGSDDACQDWFRLGADFYAIRDRWVLKRQIR